VALDPAKKVEAKRTPVTPDELRTILLAGHALALGADIPSDNRIGMAWAQVNLETARTTAAWNFNWGNIIPGSSWAGNWQVLPGLPSSEPQEYRAYSTAEEGAADYWRVVARMDRKRSGAILKAFDMGDAATAAAELRAAGYYTAPLARYQKTLTALFDEYRSELGAPAPQVSAVRRGAVVVIVVSALAVAGAMLLRVG